MRKDVEKMNRLLFLIEYFGFICSSLYFYKFFPRANYIKEERKNY